MLASGITVVCVICGKDIRAVEDVSIEHLVPVSDGGANALANLAPAHRECNYGKRPRRRTR